MPAGPVPHFGFPRGRRQATGATYPINPDQDVAAPSDPGTRQKPR
jgi:hypothetical protein